MEAIRLKKHSLQVLIWLLTFVFAAGHASSASFEKKELSEEEVKSRVESFGVGAAARVRVRLRNGVEIEGLIDRAGDDHFHLIRTDERIGTEVVIAYREVSRIGGRKTSVNWRKVAYRMGMGAGLVLSVLRELRIQGPAIAPKFPRR